MKLNKKILGIFLSVVIMAAFGAAANAQIKTTRFDLEFSNNKEVSDVAKILAAVTKEDIFLERQGLGTDNITRSNMLLGAGGLDFSKQNGIVMPIFNDYSDKNEVQVKDNEKLQNGVTNDEINKIEINEEDIEKSRAKTIKQMKAKLEEMEEILKYYNENVEKGIDFKKAGKELLEKKIEIALKYGINEKNIDKLRAFFYNEKEELLDLAKSLLSKVNVDSYRNYYIKDVKENIDKIKNVSAEEVKKAQKDVKFIGFEDVTKYNEFAGQERDSRRMEKLEEALNFAEK